MPTVHKFRYGSGCVNCHTTAAWEGTTFTHAIFSINHGKKNNTCATDHQDTKNLALYTCYNCHEHTPAKEERRHAKRNIVKLDNCIDCHGRKRGRPRAEAPQVEPLVVAFLSAEPADRFACRARTLNESLACARLEKGGESARDVLGSALQLRDVPKEPLTAKDGPLPIQHVPVVKPGVERWEQL